MHISQCDLLYVHCDLLRASFGGFHAVTVNAWAFSSTEVTSS